MVFRSVFWLGVSWRIFVGMAALSLWRVAVSAGGRLDMDSPRRTRARRGQMATGDGRVDARREWLDWDRAGTSAGRARENAVESLAGIICGNDAWCNRSNRAR